MPVIYKATNMINNLAYIGFTKGTAEDRFANHIREGHSLHRAIKEWGAENFKLEVLEESEDWLHLVTEREPALIEEHNTLTPNGYNLTRGGEYSQLEGVAVDVYDLEFNFVETVCSIGETARKYSIAYSNVHAVCKQAREGKASRLGTHMFCYSGESVHKKVHNNAPGCEAARQANTGRKRPDRTEFMHKLNESKRDTATYKFVHKGGREFTGTRYQLKDIDPSVSIGELGVLIKGGYKTHRGWKIT